tara:strand:+ start:1571 stop:1999 length:429 start_codon:yes stop_codon:yes gene_type:complete
LPDFLSSFSLQTRAVPCAARVAEDGRDEEEAAVDFRFGRTVDLRCGATREDFSFAGTERFFATAAEEAEARWWCDDADDAVGFVSREGRVRALRDLALVAREGAPGRFGGARCFVTFFFAGVLMIVDSSGRVHVVFFVWRFT